MSSPGSETNKKRGGIPISRSFRTLEDEDPDFVMGNFSAKYTARNMSAQASDAASSNFSGVPGTSHGAVTVDGFDTPSSSLKVLNSRTSQRRQSGLSNLLLNQTPSNSDVVSIVNKHLVRDSDSDIVPVKSSSTNGDSKFDSLQLQGGDITRDLYNWSERQDTHRRSHSFGAFSSAPTDDEQEIASSFADEPNVNDLRIPGGFRRDFIRKQKKIDQDNFFTKNFIEFISIYGHFAGEEIEDENDDEDEESESLMNSATPSRYNSINSATDNVLIRQNLLMRKLFLQNKSSGRTTSNFKSFILLLKAFLGTGVLFLPKSFSNGGLLYSNLMLVMFSVLSYYCFVTIIKIRSRLNVSSFGNLGLVLFGPALKLIILLCIILSQIGFSSAYIVFVATNIQHLIGERVNLQLLILLQLFFFVPMSLIRRISKLSVIILISDFFILLGLLYVYYYSIHNMAVNKVNWDNITLLVDSQNWSLFIGTAIFTYEGIGLLIPIQESMTHPESFNKILLLVMCIVTVVFVTIGSLAYISFGNDVKTVILLNFENSEWVQLLYSVLILLSTPLQLFPGIKIVELLVFRGKSEKPFDPRNIDHSIDLIKSGKRDPMVKFWKNVVRVSVVILTVTISVVGSNDLDKFVSLIGSFTCIPLIYIFPPLLHLRMLAIKSITIGEYQISLNSLNQKPWLVYVDYGVLILGVIMMLYTSSMTLYEWIS